ncbi:MAG: HAD-IA family hydrolase, partial [Ignavibacteriaceae bacterium]
ILESTKAALNQLKIDHNISEHAFNNMIGKHFVDIFIELGIENIDFEQFISVYKKLYFDFIFSSYLYPGVKEALNYLNERQIKISLLTTKTQEQAEKIVEHFNILTVFNYVMGRRDGMAHKPSPEPLLFICKELQVDPAESLIVGDTELDIQCGKSAGTKACGVLFGYRTKEQLKKEKPDFLISGLSELKTILELEYEKE